MLEQQCLGCHGQGDTFGGLDLRSRDAALKGGGRGAAVVPGDPEASLLVQAIEFADGLAMPPGGEEKKLAPATIVAFREWIAGGAPFARGEGRQAWDYAEEDVWAFRPIREARPPAEGVDPARIRTPVDSFVLAKLAGRGLEPAPQADRRALIRRVTFGLTGLPPAPEEVEAFVSDESPDAYKRLVERLLASPAYGERWGRRWLDVTRYADSGGFSNDFERPNAWRYRDYVIRSFNEDKPYDRFTLEQIAGDELFPDEPEAVIATGFLRSGPWEHTGMEVAAVSRQLFLDDVTHAAGATFLGMTLGCARCHDHKFDPIPTKDYYAVQAVFATAEFARRPVDFLPSENVAGIEASEERMRAIVEQTEQRIDAFKQLTYGWLRKQHGVESVGELPKSVVDDAVRKREGVTPEEFERLKLHNKHLQLYKESLDRFKPLAFSVVSGIHEDWFDAGPNRKAFLPEDGVYRAPETHVLIGGDVQAPGERVRPGVLTAVGRYSGLLAPEIPETAAGRRAALAKWIVNERNPLTPRVMVNRIWQYHFGKGLVDDANNFGKMGGQPTHPELLDWLARFFVEQGWSVKAVHRVILYSEAYQRSAKHTRPELLARKDPGNELLAVYSPRRLEAEELRDSMLMIAGELSESRGGPGTFPQINPEVARQPRHAMGSVQPAYRPSPEKKQRNRRSIYSFQQRTLADPLVETFDGPSFDLSCERRQSSTVPTQAFTLLNSELSHDVALAFAARLEREARGTDAQIERAFRLAYGRAPSGKELQLARAHVERMSAMHRERKVPPRSDPEPVAHRITSELTGEIFTFLQPEDPQDYEHNLHPSEAGPETRALADLALALINSNEFVYVY